MYNPYYPDYLQHHGIKGMKWGVRRYQNRDGSLTNAGQRHRDQREGDSYHPSPSRGSSERKSSGKTGKSGRLKKVLGTTLGVAAAAGAGYVGGKYLGRKILERRNGLGVPKLPGESYALKNRTAGDRLRSVFSRTASSVRGAAKSSANRLRDAYSTAKTRRNTPRLPGTSYALKTPTRADRVRSSLYRAAGSVRGAANSGVNRVRDTYTTARTRRNTPRLGDYRPTVRKKRFSERTSSAANRLKNNKAYRKYAYRRASKKPIYADFTVS